MFLNIMIILLPNQNWSLVNPRMKLILIATVFGLFEAHHQLKGQVRGEGHDDDDGDDKQQEGHPEVLLLSEFITALLF